MNSEQEELRINYKGQNILVTAYSQDVNTLFAVHLPEKDLKLKIDYVDDNPVWVEDDGIVTERSQEIGRLIEEYDGR